MIKYVLRVHSLNYGVWKHTGYSLYIKKEDGTEILQTIDFSSDLESLSAIIKINESSAYHVVDAYGHETYWDTNDQEAINSSGLEVKELLTGSAALEAFNKIKLNASLMNMSDKIDYDPISWETRVCNTATNYWANQYIPGYEDKLVTDELSGWMWGADDDYVNAAGVQQAEKIKFIENVVKILDQQGKVDEALSDTEPYLSEKYRQILEPVLQREFHVGNKLLDLALGILEGIGNSILTITEVYFDNNKSAAQTTNSGKRFGAQSHQSPLVLDLDGDGIVETHKENSTVYFDHDNNGLAESTGWVGADDGFLVRDLNDNGQIDNGTELFGNNSVLSSGATAANGFEALADLDSNQDGVFNSSDSAWNEVKVWKDANGNGRVDEGELLTLEQAGVSGINLEYQASDLSDENGNAHKQTGSFIKTDGTTGSVHDVWFDADKSDTISKEEIAIPEDIAALPDIEGWGNVRSLREAMALDESGELKALVQQYMSETDPAFRQGMLDNIIFHWTGVEDVDPLSRKPSYFYDNPIGDARYLEAQEQFWGEKYANKWWFGKEEQNPHEQASKILLQGFDIIRDYVSNALESQTHCAGFLENIKLTWNGETQIWEVDVSGAVVLLNTLAENNMDSAVQTLHNLENIIKQQDIMVEEINTAFQAYGSAESYLQLFYDKFGTLENQISNGNDIIYGTEGDNYINGLGGNDKIYGQAGDDMLIGGVGDDYLVGGEGSDTYFFEGFWGHDSIDNSSSDKVGTNPDKILFGEGISPTDVSIQRQGNDLILSLHDGADTVKVYVMNSFGAEMSSAMEMLSDAVENVSDMYSLADNSDLTGKAA